MKKARKGQYFCRRLCTLILMPAEHVFIYCTAERAPGDEVCCRSNMLTEKQMLTKRTRWHEMARWALLYVQLTLAVSSKGHLARELHNWVWKCMESQMIDSETWSIWTELPHLRNLVNPLLIHVVHVDPLSFGSQESGNRGIPLLIPRFINIITVGQIMVM